MDENLSKWLNGELTDEELIERIGKEEAIKYIQIVGEVDNWVPDHSERLFDPKEITEKPKALARSMRPWWGYAAAAAVLIFIGSYFWVAMSDSTVTYSSQIGEVREVLLPDGKSKVTLAPNSEISWEEDEWKQAIALKEKRLKAKKASRNVRLRGKALFEVEKGVPFKVESETGSVEVLGTTFEVDDFEEGLNVICFEGKVFAKPKTGSKSVTINGGEGYLFFKGDWGDKKDISVSKPEWLQNQTKFERAPLTQVIKSMEKLYGITIDKGSVDTSRRFTGAIPNDNLDVALKIVFSPFKIEYAQQGKKITLSE
ncbi:MAG: FecR domain-containing protein [Ekhidna sp.]|uniref:FecR family protein n=1 Tax=Ekhidna sp. TaxID=2608089 RepID=UPI0032EBD538